MCYKREDLLVQMEASKEPILKIYCIIYDVEFFNGKIMEYSYTQVDSNGNSASLMEANVNHKKEETVVPMNEEVIVDENGKRSYMKR